MKQSVALYLHFAVAPAEQSIRDYQYFELAPDGRIGHPSHCAQQAGT